MPRASPQTEALDQNVIDLIEPNVDALLAAVSDTTVTLGDGSTTTIPDLTELDIVRAFDVARRGVPHDLFDPNLAFIFFWVGLLLIVIEIIVPGTSSRARSGRCCC